MSVIDSAIAALSPGWALKRARARQALERISGRGFDGASSTLSPTLSDLQIVDGSADAMLWHSLPTLRSRSRHLYDNSGSGSAIIEGLVALVVSSGIDLEPDTGDRDTDARLKEAWLGLLDRLDVTGHDAGNGYEVMRGQFRAELINGESLSQQVYPSDYIGDGDVPWAILALESDQLSDEPVTRVPANHIFRAGVELDQLWRPLYFHIIEHPGDPFGIMGASSAKKMSRRIPASEMIHTFERLRPGQNRGRPVLTPILLRSLQDDDLVRFELDAARAGSLFGVKITTEALGQEYGSEPTPDDERAEDRNAGRAPKVLRRPGDVLEMGEGEDAEILSNPRPSQQIDPFRKGLRGDFAGGCRINQSWIDRDNSRANFSSMQAGLIQDMRLLGPVQLRFGAQFCRRIYQRAFNLLAVQAGIRGGRRPIDRKRLRRVKVMPDGFPNADDGKAADAAFKRVLYGLSTWQREIQRKGENPDEILGQLGREVQSPLVQFLLKINGKLKDDAPERDGDSSQPERETEEAMA